MKYKWLPITLIALPYLCVAATICLFLWHGALDLLFLPLAVLVVAGTVPNVIYAIRMQLAPEKEQELLRWARWIKLGHIPFYLLIFLLCIAMAITVVGLVLLPILLVALYAVRLPASLYAVAALQLVRARGGLERTGIRTVQLFVPGLDIIAVMELYADAGDGEV